MTLYHGLVSLHMQDAVDDWTRAASVLPQGTIIKAVDDIGILLEGQRVNPHSILSFRKWVDKEPGQHYTNAKMPEKRDRAKNYFETFIRDPILTRLRRLIIGLWNEVYATSHTPEETQDRIEQEQAFVDVWFNAYAHKLPKATLAMSSPGVGNDIPVEVAALAHEHDFFMDYHAYILTVHGSPVPGEWPLLSGRWTVMDAEYRKQGYKVKWLFGEGGPIGRTPNTQYGADAHGGWRHRDCCNGDPIKLSNVVAYWAERVQRWNKANGRRAYSAAVFTCKKGAGPPGVGWPSFKLYANELDMLANVSQRYAETTPAPIDEPDPPDPPDPPSSSLERLLVVHQAGATIRKGDGVVVGALPVGTKFLGKKITVKGEDRWALRGHVSANPNIVLPTRDLPPPSTGVAPLVPVLMTDVSHHQGDIDFAKMWERGVRVVGIKLTEGYRMQDGSLWVDQNWRRNRSGALGVGMGVFPWHYYGNNVNATEQADHFLRQHEQAAWTYEPAGDIEDQKDIALVLSDLPRRLRVFLERAKCDKIYTGAWWWDRYIGDVSWATAYDLWVATYPDPNNGTPPVKGAQPELPSPWKNKGWDIWQWCGGPPGGAPGWEYGVSSSKLDLNYIMLPLELEAWPVDSKALSGRGNTWNNPRGHYAVDLAGFSGNPVYAAADGTVVSNRRQTDGYGRYIVIQHSGYQTLYAHLQDRSPTVVAGMTVPAGWTIGAVGKTGDTSGSHLHFEVGDQLGHTVVSLGRVDPWPLLQAI